jgi:hypothetical protein
MLRCILLHSLYIPTLLLLRCVLLVLPADVCNEPCHDGRKLAIVEGNNIPHATITQLDAHTRAAVRLQGVRVSASVLCMNEQTQAPTTNTTSKNIKPAAPKSTS